MAIEIIPNLHPIFVHYTVALFSVSTALFVICFLFSNHKCADSLLKTASWNLWIGAIITIGTILSGGYAYNTVAHDAPSHMAMTSHRNWAILTTIIFIILAIYRVKYYKREKVGFYFILAISVSTALLTITAYKGGELVYRYGLGVLSLPTAGEHGHTEIVDSHHHDDASDSHSQNKMNSHMMNDNNHNHMGNSHNHDSNSKEHHSHSKSSDSERSPTLSHDEHNHMMNNNEHHHMKGFHRNDHNDKYHNGYGKGSGTTHSSTPQHDEQNNMIERKVGGDKEQIIDKQDEYISSSEEHIHYTDVESEQSDQIATDDDNHDHSTHKH